MFASNEEFQKPHPYCPECEHCKNLIKLHNEADSYLVSMLQTDMDFEKILARYREKQKELGL
jgi:hypothetical protein